MLESILKFKTEIVPIDVDCSIHKGCSNNLFCLEHSEIICVKCKNKLHDTCLVMSVCGSEEHENTNVAELCKLRDSISKLAKDADIYKSLTEENILQIETQRSDMLRDAQTILGKLMQKINYFYHQIIDEIFAVCEQQVDHLSQQKARLDVVLSDLTGCQGIIECVSEKELYDIKEFGSIQEVVKMTKKYDKFLNDLEESSTLVDISLDLCQDTPESLTSSFLFGSVEANSYKYNPLNNMQKFNLPIVKEEETLQTDVQFESSFASLPKIVENEQTISSSTESMFDMSPRINLRDSVNIRTECDNKSCLITDIVVTGNRRRIVADSNNYKVKLYSSNMKLLSTLTLSSAPYGIVNVDMHEIAVCSKDKILHFIDMYDDKLTTIQKLKVNYTVHDITAHKDQLFFSCGTNPPSVKKIDKSGHTLWTACKNNLGHKHFKSIPHITCSTVNDDVRIVATDVEAETATIIDGETGNVLAAKPLKGKGPRKITTDSYGNIYICCVRSSEICMMTRDLTDDIAIVSIQNGMHPYPLAIAYDSDSDQIIISNKLYFHKGTVSVFQKSFYI